jgi:S-(hydroxymethyl)glutathione dehydrogenase/alcohol dehydrogenase
VIDASRENPVARVRALTGGFGVDYAFEVISHPTTIEQAYESLHKGGVAIIVGISPLGARVTIDPLAMMRTGRTIMGSAIGSIRPAIDFPRILELYRAGKLRLKEMVSRTFTLEQTNEAFRALAAGEVIRGVVVFD